MLLYGGSAPAFTLIAPEQVSPSSSITDATTLEKEIQPLVGAIRAQLFSLQRLKRAQKVTQLGPTLVASAEPRGGFETLAAESRSGAGSLDPGGGNTESLWISTTADSLENDFARTAFYGATHNLVAGFDVTRGERFVLGIALGHEASNFTTTFNLGSQKVRGYSVSPYFAYLLSDAWSLDLMAGYGDLKTRQSRTDLLTPAVVDSEFSSKRSFASTNLTHIAAWGNWRLSSALGYTATKQKQDAYVESGASGSAVGASERTVEQYNLLGEAAYGGGASETYLGLMYEKTRDPVKVQFPFGPQPANDPDSVLLSAGWRYFGKGLSANFALSRRLAQDQVREYGFTMMLRVDL